MRLRLLIIFTLFFPLQAVLAVDVVATPSKDCVITSTLRIGSKGVEVQCLQSTFNLKSDGNFGPQTKTAVIAWQKNNSLTADGVFGAKSRATLFGTSLDLNYPAGCTSSVGYSIITGNKCDGISIPTISTPVTNNTGSSIDSTKNDNTKKPEPSGDSLITAKIQNNLVGLDQLIKTVVEVNRKKGASEVDLQVMADAIKKEALNSNIDYKKEFEALLAKEASANSVNNKPVSTFFNKIISKTLTFLGITPSIAQASAALPFGGALLGAFFCPYNLSWMITVQPLPPTYVVLLTYFPGTQLRASFNIPFTNYLVGSYVTPGVCVIPAGFFPIFIPTEGVITPMTGSSPL